MVKMIHDDGNILEPDIEYCDRCGVPVEINEIWNTLQVPLCKECWFEQHNEY